MSASPGHASFSPIKAAQYLRMSTDMQDRSIDIQAEAIGLYARKRGFEIVQTYQDDGRSGLTIAGRPGLQKLMADVTSGQAGFSAILAFDVSRWGRFQDTDESAHYEFLCRQMGLTVHYCAELFENDQSPASVLIKGIKRLMAGEYSRELSGKSFAGQARTVRDGFHRGGVVGYGLRRQLVDRDGTVKGLLAPGERRAIQSDRIRLVPGPASERKIVGWIYHLYVNERFGDTEIARILNNEGIPTESGKPWAPHNVTAVLRSPNYAGDLVYNRTSQRLRTKQIRHAPEDWVVCRNALRAIVPRRMFDAAQAVRQSRYRSNQQLLSELAALLAKKGRLTARTINADALAKCPSVYRKRFGGLTEAYRQVGFFQASHAGYVVRRRERNQLRERIVMEFVARVRNMGLTLRRMPTTNVFVIADELRIGFANACATGKSMGNLRHHLARSAHHDPHLTVVLVSDKSAERLLYIHMLSWAGIEKNNGRATTNEVTKALSGPVHDTLEPVYELIAHTLQAAPAL